MDDHLRTCLLVYYIEVQSVDELKQRLIQVWCSLNQDIVDMAIDRWCKRL